MPAAGPSAAPTQVFPLAAFRRRSECGGMQRVGRTWIDHVARGVENLRQPQVRVHSELS